MRILLVYINDDEKLKACLESLKKYSPEIPIDLVKANQRDTQCAEQMYNKYLEKGVEDDIMIWHPDMLATEGWHNDLLKYWDSFEVMGVKLLYPNNLVNHYGGAIRHDGMGFHPHQYSLDIGLNTPLSTAFVTGPGMIIKKKVLNKIRWDENFTFYVDVDFCFQARANGFTVGVIPVTLYHLEAQDRIRFRETERFKEGQDKFTAKWLHVLGEYR